jgi:hypothetical protein
MYSVAQLREIIRLNQERTDQLLADQLLDEDDSDSDDDDDEPESSASDNVRTLSLTCMYIETSSLCHYMDSEHSLVPTV